MIILCLQNATQSVRIGLLRYSYLFTFYRMQQKVIS